MKRNFTDRTDVGDGFPVPREAKRLPYGRKRNSVIIEAAPLTRGDEKERIATASSKPRNDSVGGRPPEGTELLSI